jgi:hypothetical protein
MNDAAVSDAAARSLQLEWNVAQSGVRAAGTMQRPSQSLGQLQPLRTANASTSNSASAGPSSAAAVGDTLEWQSTTGFDISTFFRNVTDPTSWWCHGAAAVLVAVVCAIALISARPSFVLEKSADGVVTDAVSLPKLLGIAVAAGGLTLGISLWVHGIPQT